MVAARLKGLTIAERSRISVALCTFNGSHFVAEQVMSILDQSRPPSEVIVSDDGSTDETVEIISGIANATQAEISILSNSTSLGVTANFEQAVRSTSGLLIALSDQDDIWRRDKLETLEGLLEAKPNVDLVHTDARLIDESGVPTGGTLFASLEIAGSDLKAEQGPSAFDVLLRRNLVTGATMVFRRRLLENALPFPGDWVHDEWLAIIAAATGRIAVSHEQTLDYRQHDSNAIGVSAPTLGYKIRRVLEPRGRRNAVLAAKFATLAARLERLPVPESVLDSARRKAAFEAMRAALPKARLKRVPPVLRAARAGLYRRFASRGRADIIRDLLQPA